MNSLPFADIIFPVYLMVSPLLALAFIPLCLVEMIVMKLMLRIRFRRVIWPVILSNLMTTFLGVPILGIALALIPINCRKAGPFGFACYYPGYDASFNMVGTVVIYIILCLGLSFIAEAPLNRVYLAPARDEHRDLTAPDLGRIEKRLESRSVWMATLWANIASYALLGIIALFSHLNSR